MLTPKTGGVQTADKTGDDHVKGTEPWFEMKSADGSQSNGSFVASPSPVGGTSVISPTTASTLTTDTTTDLIHSPLPPLANANMGKNYETYTNRSASPHGFGVTNFGRDTHMYNGSIDGNSSIKRSGRGGNAVSNNSRPLSNSDSPRAVNGPQYAPHHGSHYSATQSGGRHGRDFVDGRGGRRQFRSSGIDDIHSQNHALVEGKLVRILQRPSLQTGGASLSDRSHSDDTDTDKSSPEALLLQQQQLKRGHRKKTLSLNPEEREALESLVEEVIIGGLDEAIVDSDGTTSSSDDEVDHRIRNKEMGKGSGTDFSRHSDKNSDDGRDGKSGSAKGGKVGDRNYVQRSNGKQATRSNNGKDFNRRGGRETPNARSKDVKRPDEPQKGKPGSPEEENEKPVAATVRGVNIYPAQLKVAIKHMDSLPPRFLRRLQTGTSRTAGNESLIARLTLQSPLSGKALIESVKAEDASMSPTDRDKGRSKQTQLQETKKTIRNLLSDLNQYTDETVTKEDCASSLAAAEAGSVEAGFPLNETSFVVSTASAQLAARGQAQPYFGQQQYGLGVPPFVPSGHSPTSKQVSGPPPFSQSSLPFSSPQPPRMLSCEELEREMLLGTSKSTPFSSAGSSCNQPGSLSSSGGSSKTAVIQQSLSGQFFAPPPPLDASIFYSPQSPVSLSQPSPGSTKKLQFSVDASEFVPSFYTTPNRQTPSIEHRKSDGHYASPPVNHTGSELQIQLLNDNVHLPTKSHQYPAYAALPQAQANIAEPEFTDMSGGAGVMPASYQMVPYEQVDGVGLGMVRNNASYAVPGVGSPMTASGEVLSPTAVDMNGMQYQGYQYMSSGAGYSAAFQPGQEFTQPPPSYIAQSSPRWMNDVQNPSQQPPPAMMGWYQSYPGMSYQNNSFNQPQSTGFDDSVYASSPGGYQAPPLLPPGDGDAWSFVGMPSTTAPTLFEVGRQKVLQLLSDGVKVMVILIGGPDGDKMSLVSDLPMSGNGALILNIRNGMSAARGGGNKVLEVHQWNVQQVAVAIEARKSPIIIDHTYAQPWERETHIQLAERNGYHVEIIDSTTLQTQLLDSGMAGQHAFGSELYSGAVQPPASSDMYRGPLLPSGIYQTPSASKDVPISPAMANI